TGVFGINNSGEMVGNIIDNAGVNHGFLFQDGAFTQIDVPGASHTFTFGINDKDEIVGFYIDSGGAQHGYLRTDDGSFITIDVPGATATNLRGINDQGSITGDYRNASVTHAFVCRGAIKISHRAIKISQGLGVAEGLAWAVPEWGSADMS